MTPRGTSNGTVVSYWPPQPSKLPNDTSHKNATSVPSPSPIAPSGGRLAPFSSENHSAQQVFVFAVNNSMIILDDCQVLRPPSIELWRNITCNYMLRAGLKQKYGLDDLNFIIKVVSQSTSTSELNSSASDNRTLQMLPSPSDISTSLAITFATEVLIRSQEKNIYSEKIFRDAMEEIVHKNVSYLKDLKRTGDSDFKNVGTVQVFTNGVAIQPREAVPAGISSSSRGVGILSSCIIGATLLLVTAAWGCNHKLNPKKKVSDELMRSWDVATTASAFHEPCFQGKT